jgi:hypothetical protein
VEVLAVKRALAAIVMLLPVQAWACPTCATRDSARGVYLLVGLMIAVPYVVAAVAYRIIRRTVREDAKGSAR